MGKVADIRAGLAEAMTTITGLQCEPYVRDIANVPVAMVGGPEIEYDKTFGRGHDDYLFGILVFVSRVIDDESQITLDGYLDPFGPTSIKAAIEAATATGGSLEGVVEDVIVRETREYEPHNINGIVYLGAALLVHVMASGKA